MSVLICENLRNLRTRFSVRDWNSGDALLGHPIGQITYVVCLPDNAILKANLLKSPCLAGPRSPHEVLAIHDAPSAAAALNLATSIGWVNDRGRQVVDGPKLPARVATLDELLMIVRRNAPL